ncbi:50S ribosomal protein L22 [bacterium]|nr:50S ribosomal protein L22 [candidate division CSSED10-310 bacterium]
MKSRAVGRYIRISPFKARLVADLVRGKGVEEALAIMRYTPKKASRLITKLVRSAMSNAENNHGVDDVDQLFISAIYVDQGPSLKRFRPRAMGRATRIRKKTSHITVELDEQM